MKHIDKLKQMTSTELSKILSDFGSCDTCIIKDYCKEQPTIVYCYEVITSWLETEADN